MDISWEDAQTFLAVSEQQSFSAAARHLGLGQPTISRRIATLEERLGCQLFRRGKRGAELTDEGARLLPAAEQMARWAGEFGRLASGAEDVAEGIVRIAAAPGVAVDFLAPFARIARDRLPGIRLQVLSSISHIDLSRGGADLAVRTRAPHEPELMTLRSAASEFGVFASRDYVASLTSPVTMSGLDWISWGAPYEHLPPRPMLERLVPDFVPAFSTDDYLVQQSAAVAGVGAMILERRRSPLSLSAELVEIEVELPLPSAEFHLVCAKSMRFVPRVKAVADLLIEQLDLAEAAFERRGWP